MSEIRERAKDGLIALQRWNPLGTERYQHDLIIGVYQLITDLLAELERVEKERDRLADDALTALSGVVCTPIEGFVKVPYELKTGIMDLRKLKEAAEHRIDKLETENACLKHDISGSFFVEHIREKARQQAAIECVEIVGNGGWYNEDLENAIKAHFGIKGE